MANGFLFLLIILMIFREVEQLLHHRRGFRLASLAFWALLGVVHVSGRPELYPALVATLLFAIWMKWRQPHGSGEEAREKLVPGPSRPPRGRASGTGTSTVLPDRMKERGPVTADLGRVGFEGPAAGAQDGEVVTAGRGAASRSAAWMMPRAIPWKTNQWRGRQAYQ